MGRYISSEAVIVRLRGKVKVTSNPEAEPDRMPLLLLNRLINEAEGQVEMDLSPRYLAPFATTTGANFSQLPTRPTQEVLKTMCELLAVIRVLETDFGRGSSVDGSKYSDQCQKRYDRMVYGDEEKNVPGMLTTKKNSFNIFVLPPLPGLASNYQVAAVDSGFAGYVGISGTTGDGGYPAHQINDPSENFYNGYIEGSDGSWY